jgi:hypothetical protein
MRSVEIIANLVGMPSHVIARITTTKNHWLSRTFHRENPKKTRCVRELQKKKSCVREVQTEM